MIQAYLDKYQIEQVLRFLKSDIDVRPFLQQWIHVFTLLIDLCFYVDNNRFHYQGSRFYVAKEEFHGNRLGIKVIKEERKLWICYE